MTIVKNKTKTGKIVGNGENTINHASHSQKVAQNTRTNHFHFTRIRFARKASANR